MLIGNTTALLPESECKGKAKFYTNKLFEKFFQQKKREKINYAFLHAQLHKISIKIIKNLKLPTTGITAIILFI